MCRGHVRARACVCECVCVRGSSWWVCPQGTIPKEAQNFTSLWPPQLWTCWNLLEPVSHPEKVKQVSSSYGLDENFCSPPT